MSGLVVVCQGAGFLGQWCAVEAIRQGFRVRAVAHTPDEVVAIMDAVPRRVAVEGMLEAVVVDPFAPDSWTAAVAGASFVLNTGLVPAPPESLAGLNQQLLERLLHAAHAAGVERVVHTSAVGAAVPSTEEARVDETVWTDPTTAVDGAVDAVVERAAIEQADRLGLHLITLLPGTMLGETVGEGPHNALALVADLMFGRTGDVPRRSVEIVDVRDVAAAHITALRSPAATGRYLLPGEAYWMVEVARVLRHRIGSRADAVPTTELTGWRRTVVGWLTPAGSRPDIGTPYRLRHSSERARRDLDWEPRYVDDTLVETAELVLRTQRTP